MLETNDGGYTCRFLCERSGMTCVDGWEENGNDGCDLSERYGCDSTNDDTVCECSLPGYNLLTTSSPTTGSVSSTAAGTAVVNHPPMQPLAAETTASPIIDGNPGASSDVSLAVSPLVLALLLLAAAVAVAIVVRRTLAGKDKEADRSSVKVVNPVWMPGSGIVGDAQPPPPSPTTGNARTARNPLYDTQPPLSFQPTGNARTARSPFTDPTDGYCEVGPHGAVSGAGEYDAASSVEYGNLAGYSESSDPATLTTQSGYMEPVAGREATYRYSEPNGPAAPLQLRYMEPVAGGHAMYSEVPSESTGQYMERNAAYSTSADCLASRLFAVATAKGVGGIDLTGNKMAVYDMAAPPQLPKYDNVPLAANPSQGVYDMPLASENQNPDYMAASGFSIAEPVLYSMPMDPGSEEVMYSATPVAVGGDATYTSAAAEAMYSADPSQGAYDMPLALSKRNPDYTVVCGATSIAEPVLYSLPMDPSGTGSEEAMYSAVPVAVGGDAMYTSAAEPRSEEGYAVFNNVSDGQFC